MRTRHRGRESAFQFLYRLDSLRTLSVLSEPTDLQARLLELEAEFKHFDVPEQCADFGRELAMGTLHHLAAIDSVLQAESTHWKVERMPAVDRNVLRVATFELLHTQTPVAVVVDEALELVKKYSAVDSPAFVNGVLDKIAKDRPLSAIQSAS